MEMRRRSSQLSRALRVVTSATPPTLVAKALERQATPTALVVPPAPRRAADVAAGAGVGVAADPRAASTLSCRPDGRKHGAGDAASDSSSGQGGGAAPAQRQPPPMSAGVAAGAHDSPSLQIDVREDVDGSNATKRALRERAGTGCSGAASVCTTGVLLRGLSSASFPNDDASTGGSDCDQAGAVSSGADGDDGPE